MGETQVHESIAVLNEMEHCARRYMKAFDSGEESFNFRASYIVIMTLLNIVPAIQIPLYLDENTVTRLHGIAAIINRVKHQYSEKLIAKIRIILKKFPDYPIVPVKNKRG